jgi:gamma-glutamyltranspeptidase/glutathione hydrolase
MVSAGHPLAAQVGLRVLDAGGNAVDAGVAAGFALNVVQPDMANLGGVAPIMMRLAATNRITTIAGIGRWPRLATLEAVAAAGNGRIPVAPQRWVVPAAVGSWLTALELYGTMSASEILAPAIELASGGFPSNYFLSNNLAACVSAWTGFPHNIEIFLPNGRAPVEGELVRQSALGQTLQVLVDAETTAGGSRETGIRASRDAFYKGDIARAVDSFSRDVGGFIRADDMAAFSASEEEPYSVSYRGNRVYACGPWSQGPAVLQMLKLADRFDLGGMGEADRAHVLIEVAKRALADRNRYYGDPDFVSVPMQHLLSDQHADELLSTIDLSQAGDVHRKDPVPGKTSPDTTYVCVIDSEGNAFSATPSDSTILVTPMVSGLGFGISDRGLQASLDKDDPNCVAPGKRPRLTPNPGLIMGETSMMVYGTPGGEVQTQAMLQFLVNRINLGFGLQESVEQPRWASTAVPATEDPHPMTLKGLRIEAPLDDAIGDDLRARGHQLQRWPALAALAGGICAAERNFETAVVTGAADPRRMSYAAGR